MPTFQKMLLATCLECVFGRVFVGEVEAHFILNYPPPQVCTLKEKSPSFLEVPSHPQNPLGSTAPPTCDIILTPQRLPFDVCEFAVASSEGQILLWIFNQVW